MSIRPLGSSLRASAWSSLRYRHLVNPLSEDGPSDGGHGLDFERLESHDFGDCVGQDEDKFVVAVGSEWTQQIEMYHGVGDLRLFCVALSTLQLWQVAG